MKVNLISNNYKDKQLDPLQVVFLNRGFKKEEILPFLNSTDEVISSPSALGQQNLIRGMGVLFNCITNNEKAVVIVDVDVDGYTSASLLINYLFRIVPVWVQEKLSFFIHEKKIHGLKDSYEQWADSDIKLVICPDSASSDYDEIEYLYSKGKEILVLDHHPAPKISEYGVIINNQLCDYPNKALSGVGVVWQFCRFLDEQLGLDNANEFLDLVALGLIADVMSLASIETKHLIQKGLKQIKNPFIYNIIEKNSYSLRGELTPFGVSMYIAPFVNAMTRFGTKAEQTIVFNSFLEHKAYEKILSTKRGHKLGEMEMIIQQAFRLTDNVKNRQTKSRDIGQELIEKKIKEENLLDKHKILMILLDKDEIAPSLAGLIANKLMDKYQRPVCILSKKSDGVYSGSARNYERSGFSTFRELCESTNLTVFQAGHSNAFGLALEEDKIESFLKVTDEALKDLKSEPVYSCDFAIDINNLNSDLLSAIADNEILWGKDLEKPLFYITGIKILPDSLWLMKADTLKIKTSIPILKFNAKDVYEDLLVTQGYKEINIVAEASASDYMGEHNYQLKLIDYEIVDTAKYYF